MGASQNKSKNADSLTILAVALNTLVIEHILTTYHTKLPSYTPVYRP